MIFRYLLSFAILFLLCAPSLRAQQDNSSMPPAAMSELARNGVSLKTTVINPSSGVYAGISDLIRQDQYARVINNLQMTKKGVWTSRDTGYTADSSVPVAGRVNSLFQSATFPTDIFCHIKDKAYRYTASTQTFGADVSNSLFVDCQSCQRNFITTPIITFYSQTKEPAYFNAGTGLWTGGILPATLSSVSYTKPKFCESFQSRLVLGGFAANPYTIIISNPNGGTWTQTVPIAATDAGAITFPSVLGKITGLYSYRYGTGNSDNVLLVACEKGIGMVTGSSALNYVSVELTREFGIPSNETWQELEGELYFLSTDGLRKMSVYNDSGDFRSTIISQPVASLLNRVNKAVLEKAFAVKHVATQEIQFWFPIDLSSEPQNCIILNYNTRTLEPGSEYQTLKPAFSSKDGLTITCGLDFLGTMYGGTLSGYLTKHYNGDTYEGSPINWQYVSPLIGANSPAQNASLKKFVILTDGPAQKFTAQAYTLSTHADGTTRWIQQASQAINVATQTVSAVDAWDSGTTSSYPKFIEYSPMGSGRFWCLKLSGAATDEHISLVGLQAILNLGGWKQ